MTFHLVEMPNFQQENLVKVLFSTVPSNGKPCGLAFFHRRPIKREAPRFCFSFSTTAVPSNGKPCVFSAAPLNGKPCGSVSLSHRRSIKREAHRFWFFHHNSIKREAPRLCSFSLAALSNGKPIDFVFSFSFESFRVFRDFFQRLSPKG